MYRAPPVVARASRRGIILLVVTALLTLFAAVGLSFVFYSEAQARMSCLGREAEARGRADLDPALLLAFFLGQVIYDVPDGESGVYSALRGHSLARSMYGYNDDPGALNTTPFNGTGRLHTGPPSYPYLNPFGI